MKYSWQHWSLKYVTAHKMAPRQAPRFIANDVMSRDVLEVSEFSPRHIYGRTHDNMNWLSWLAEHRLLRNKKDCMKCGTPMGLVKCRNSPDGYIWNCVCKTQLSIRTGSFFSKCMLSTDKIVMMIYYWIYEVRSKYIMQFEEINSWQTVVNYTNYFRVECDKWLQKQNVELGGFDENGESLYVEVGETYFFHRKYHRGHYQKGIWVVGLVERGSGKCWLEMVNRRDSHTLEKIVSDHVLPGTTIVTDGWPAYSNLGIINNAVYQHEVVVHTDNFVSPLHPDIHTQTIEGIWMHAKRQIRYQSGTSRSLFRSYLSTFQWRFWHKNHLFGQYLKLLSENYEI